MVAIPFPGLGRHGSARSELPGPTCTMIVLDSASQA